MKLLLAEDTEDLNRVITAILTHEGFEVDSTYDGVQALERLTNEGYDGVILDIMMPRMDGIQVLKEIRQRRITTPVLLLTAKAEVDDRVAGLDAGADDYLPKPFAMKELMARVRAMTRRRASYDTEKISYADFLLDPETLELSCTNAVRLSLKEYELLDLLIHNAETGMETEQVLTQVWAAEPDADADTLWLYVNYLRRKLQVVGSAISIAGERGGHFTMTAQEAAA